MWGVTDRAELERRVRRVVAVASVMAEAPGVSFIPSGHSDYDHQEPTTGTGGNLVDRIRRRCESSSTERDLLRALDWAEEQIETTKRRTLPPSLPFRQRILIEWAGHHYKAVARVTSTPPTNIRRWREEAGLQPLDGLVPSEDVR
jgi:hypothetical protein